MFVISSVQSPMWLISGISGSLLTVCQLLGWDEMSSCSWWPWAWTSESMGKGRAKLWGRDLATQVQASQCVPGCLVPQPRSHVTSAGLPCAKLTGGFTFHHYLYIALHLIRRLHCQYKIYSVQSCYCGRLVKLFTLTWSELQTNYVLLQSSQLS